LSARQREVEKELETLRANLTAAQQEQDGIRAANAAREAELKLEHNAAMDKLADENKAQLEELNKLTLANMDNLNKMHEQHGQDHEARLQRVLTSHKDELQGLEMHHKTLLESKEKEHKEKVTSLEQKLENAQGNAAALAELEKIQRELEQVKVRMDAPCDPH